MSNKCKNKLIITGKPNDILIFREFLPVFDFNKIYPVNQSEINDDGDKFGPLSAYVWKANHWGVGESIQESETPNYSERGGENRIEFLFTVSSAPTGIVQKLGEIFPHLKFRLFYLNEGNYAGVHVVESKRHRFSEKPVSSDPRFAWCIKNQIIK